MKILTKTDKLNIIAEIKIEYKNGKQRVLINTIDIAGICFSKDKKDNIYLTTTVEQDLSIFKHYKNFLGAKNYFLKGEINKVSLTLSYYAANASKSLFAYIKNLSLLTYGNKLSHFVLICDLAEKSNYEEFEKDNEYLIDIKEYEE